MLSIVQEMVGHDSVTPLQLNMGLPGERPHGWTALHMAVDGVAPLPARSQRLDLVRVVLRARADPLSGGEKLFVARLSCLAFGVAWALCW